MMNPSIDALSEAISIKYNNLVYELRSNGADIIVLSLGEAFFDIPRYDFGVLPYPDLYHYSHSRGLPSLRDRIAKYYSDSYSVVADSSREVLITAGSKIGVYYALQTIVQPGDEVILIEPFWVSYSEQVKLVGGVPKFVPIGDGIAGVEDQVSSKTRAIIVNNPQNPTGKNFQCDDLQRLFDIASKHKLWVISDEAYSDFVREDDAFISFGRVDTEFERTVIVNSISKNFGISGWRIGYLISQQPIVDNALKIAQHTMTCAPTPLLMYLDQYFEEIIQITKPQIRDLLQKRGRVNNVINQLELIAEPGNSTFYFFLDISSSSLASIDFCDRLLAEHFVAAVPGIGYGESCDHHIRISIGTESEDRINEGLMRIRDLIEETQLKHS